MDFEELPQIYTSYSQLYMILCKLFHLSHAKQSRLARKSISVPATRNPMPLAVCLQTNFHPD